MVSMQLHFLITVDSVFFCYKLKCYILEDEERNQVNLKTSLLLTHSCYEVLLLKFKLKALDHTHSGN